MAKNPIKKYKRGNRIVYITTIPASDSPDGKKKTIELSSREAVAEKQNALLSESKNYAIKDYKLSRDIEDAVRMGLNELPYDPTPAQVVQIFNDHIKSSDSDSLSRDMDLAVRDGIASLPYNPTPAQVVKIFTDHAKDSDSTTITFRQLWINKMKTINPDFAPENIGISDKGDNFGSNYSNLRFIGKSFSENHADIPIRRITRTMVYDFLGTFTNANITSKASYRRFLAAIFADAVEAGRIDINPAHSVTRKRTFFKKPKLLTLEKIKLILATAPEELIPYYTICLFAGLRQSEIFALNWKEVIDLNGDTPRIIVFDPKGSRDRGTPNRKAQIMPVLRAWLLPYKNFTGPVFPKRWKATKVATHRKEIGLLVDCIGKEENYKLYPPNCLRHTACTAWCALTDEYASAKQVGNSAKKQRSNYNHVWVHNEETEFFALTPERIKNEVKMVGTGWDLDKERKVSL